MGARGGMGLRCGGYMDRGGGGYGYAALLGCLTSRSALAGIGIGVIQVSVWCDPRPLAVGRARGMELRLVALGPDGWFEPDRVWSLIWAASRASSGVFARDGSRHGRRNLDDGPGGGVG